MVSHDEGRGQSDEAEEPVTGESPTGRRGHRRHRRVSTSAVEGTDATPQREPRRHAENENDERLAADKPPHWG
jgi:hypothetical protein